MVNVRNGGAVNNGENTASGVISDAGSGGGASRSIDGDRLRQRYPGTAGDWRAGHHVKRAANT
jgi:hypothetical protein